VAMPEDVGSRVTSPLYLVSAECEALYEKAQASGAEIVLELRTMDYGGKAFSVVDPEGYLWSVGEYDPWASHSG